MPPSFTDQTEAVLNSVILTDLDDPVDHIVPLSIESRVHNAASAAYENDPKIEYPDKLNETNTTISLTIHENRKEIDEYSSEEKKEDFDTSSPTPILSASTPDSLPTTFNTKSEKGLTTKPSRKKGSTVQFSTIKIREYDRIIGDNPACSSGPPMTFDWSYTQKPPISVNEYETSRQPRRRKKRQHLYLAFTTRRNIMGLHFGATEEEMDKAEKKIKVIRKGRLKSKKDGIIVEKTRWVGESIRGLLLFPFRRRLSYSTKSGIDPKSDSCREGQLRSILISSY